MSGMSDAAAEAGPTMPLLDVVCVYMLVLTGGLVNPVEV